ncbi:response regulator [Candidatus Nitrosopumilus sediminis]|uniref:Response regulator receiver protein n=1 Tax=Candidatus Nitrosopumilus sediminis TaxID=1229909 RepID=K0BC70_9ARCH|nr:response regulator [Candidatus Nitrosopumilus sediminis]AFS81911.1 response regulator receiver protein [Candidatus Nitrosopumilus sediminis]
MILDVSIPGYDGVYALKRIHRYDSAKMIMVTGDKTENTAERLRQIGPVAVLYKPYDFKELLKIINT